MYERVRRPVKVTAVIQETDAGDMDWTGHSGNGERWANLRTSEVDLAGWGGEKTGITGALRVSGMKELVGRVKRDLFPSFVISIY